MHQNVSEGVFIPIVRGEEEELKPTSIHDLFDKIQKDKNIKVHDMTVPFQKDIQLYDFALHSRGQDEDKMYAAYAWYRQFIRRGNTILSRKESDNNPEPSLMYGRKGFEKFFDLMIEYVQYNLNEIQDFGGLSLGDADTHNGLYDIIFKQAYEAIEKGLKINVCKLVKANGENAQISWIKDVGAWLIASKNVSMLVRDENDLGLYRGDRFHFAKLIGKEWIRIAQRIEKEGLIDELKENMNGRTFVGEYCGNQKYQHLVKYTEIDIHFVAIVENELMTTCVPPSEAFAIFEKFNLTRVGLKNVGTYDNWTTLNQTLKQIYIDVATAKIDSEEEGSVIYLTKVDESEGGKQETLSLAKLKTLEYRIYRKLREKLRGFISQGNSNYKPWRDYFERFCKETEELCRELKPPKELGYYFDIAKEAFEYGENYWEQSSIVNDEYITFLSVLMSSMSQNLKLKPEHFENTSQVLSIPWSEHYEKYKTREKTVEEVKMEIEPVKLKPKKRVYVVVPIGIPGMGKTYFLEGFRKTVEKSGCELSVISSDGVRKECMDRLGRNNKRLTTEQLYEKTGKDSRNLFNDRLRDLISKSDQRNCKAHFIFIDKNHPPNAIKGTLDLIHGSSYHLDLEIIALAPLMQGNLMKYDEEEGGRSHQYPFSANFFFTCFDRVQRRKEHETLPGSGAKTAGIMVMFIHMFRNVNLNKESLASNGFHKLFEVPFTNEMDNSVATIPENLMESLYNVLRVTKPGEKCEDQGLVAALNENYEKAELQLKNPEAGFVEECVGKFFQEEIQPTLAKIPDTVAVVNTKDDCINVNGKEVRIEDPRASEDVYNPSSLPLYLGLFPMEDPSFEVREYVLRGLELLSKTYPDEKVLVNNYNELKDGSASNLTYITSLHITTLYIGNNFRKKETEYFKSFRPNVVIDMEIVGFVIVPNKVVAAICYPDQSIIKIDNRFPHITLMKGQWPPKSSNDVFEALFGKSGPLCQKYNKREFETDKEFTYKAFIKLFKGSGTAFVVKTGPHLKLKFESRPSNIGS